VYFRNNNNNNSNSYSKMSGLQSQVVQEQEMIQQLQNALLGQQQRITQLEQMMVNRSIGQAKPPKPDTFDGRSLKSIEQWLFEIEQYLQLTHTGAEHWVNICSSYLRGSAATWWRKCYQDAKTLNKEISWNSFKQSLLQRFRPIEASKTARSILDTLRQTGSVSGYCDAFLRQIQLIDDTSVAEQIHCFTRGLKPVIAREVDMFQPKTLEEAMAIATRADLRSKLYGNQSREFPSFTRSTNMQRNVITSGASTSVPMELGVIEDNNEDHGDMQVNVAMSNSAGKFYGRTGNLNREQYDRLSRERRCFRCGQTGHLARNCTAKSSMSNAHAPLKQ
jgi:hypothetical protein